MNGNKDIRNQDSIVSIGNRLETSIQDIISKLRFLSKVKKGERLQVDELAVVENTWYAKISRAWVNWSDAKSEKDKIESREKSLIFIKELYETGIKFAKTIIRETSSYYSDLWNMLIQALKDAQPGIKNLISSYESDRLYISKVETFVDLLNARIHDLEIERKNILDEKEAAIAAEEKREIQDAEADE